MALATIQSRSRQYRPLHARSQGNLRAMRSNSLLPNAKVQDMLREIAFVLHATRRISNAMLEAHPDAKSQT